MQRPSERSETAATRQHRQAAGQVAAASVPPTKALRERLLSAVQEYVRRRAPAGPLSLDELRDHCRRIARAVPEAGGYQEFLAVLLNNEVWREPLAGVPYSRRALLLPQCLRDADACRGELTDTALRCEGCGQCCIDDLAREASRLGYAVLITHNAQAIVDLLEVRRPEGLIGVGCLAQLRRVFPYMCPAAMPAVAVPLLNDGCRNGSVDLDWLWEAIYLTRDDETRRLDLKALLGEVQALFTPAGLDEVLGPASTETETIARGVLLAAQPRWRALLAVCACKALRPAQPNLPRDLRQLAVAAECFHAASAIHADLAGTAAGAAAELQASFGLAIALNAGDLLLGEGYRLVAESAAPPGRKVEMLRAAAEGHRAYCIARGEGLRQSSPRPAGNIDVALYLGAMLAGAGENVWEVLAHYSRALADAFIAPDPAAVEAAKQRAIRALSGLLDANLKGILRRVLAMILHGDQPLHCCPPPAADR